MFNTTPILRNSYITNNDSIRRVWNLAEMKYSASGDASVTPNTLVQGYSPGKYRRWEPADYKDLYTTPEPGVIEHYISLEDNPT
ncbi:hypothetical protein, partial [Saccharophagus degradans]